MLRRRIGQGLLLLFAASLLSFGFAALTPGEYFDDLRLNPSFSPETIDAMEARYGLDQPLPRRYLRWLGSMARGELGVSILHQSPVAPLLFRRARNTLLLTVSAMVLAWAIAIPVGIAVADSRKAWVLRLFASSTSALLAIPDILLALLLLLLAAKTGLFPIGEMTSAGFRDLSRLGQLADLLHHLVLPVTAVVVGILPGLVRQVHASLAETLGSPYLQAARARGVPRARLLYHHALAASANPLISLFGLSVASLLSASVLVEYVMDWPGLGPLLVSAIFKRDVDVVTASVLLSTCLLVVGNLLADILLYVIDPRTRVVHGAPPR